MRPLLVSPRIGVPCAVLVAATTLVSLLGETSRWRGLWSLTNTALDESLVLAVPVACATCAWIGGRYRRQGVLALNDQASRSLLRVELRLFVEPLAWILLGGSVASLVAYVATGTVAGSAQIHVAGQAPRLALLSVSGAVGLLAGRSMHPLVAVPTSLLGPYLTIGSFSYFASETLAITTPIDSRLTPFSVPDLVPEMLQTLLWVGVTLALVLAVAGRRRLALALGWAMSLVLAALLLGGIQDREHQPQLARPECTRSASVLVCLPAAQSYLLPEALNLIEEVRALLAGLVPAKVAWVEEDVEWGAQPTQDWQDAAAAASSAGYTRSWASRALMESSYAQLDEQEAQASLVAVAIPVSLPTHDPETSRSPATPVNDALVGWALEELNLPRDGYGPGAAAGLGYLRTRQPGENEARLAWFDGLSEQARAAFLESHANDIVSGSLTWEEFSACERC